jgi:hypothetical protein
VNHPALESSLPPQFPLDDVPDDEVRDAVALLWWLRQVPRPLHVMPGTYTWRLCLDLEGAGYVDLLHAGGEDADMTELFRAELRPLRRRAVR